jgi:hypothetical protein
MGTGGANHNYKKKEQKKSASILQNHDYKKKEQILHPYNKS